MSDILLGSLRLVGYFAPMAAGALTLRLFIKIPDEIFRKTLHCILLGSLLVFVFGFQHWYSAALVSLGFAVVVYPILAFFETFRGYSQLTTERKQGELKQSLLLVFGMFTFVIALCWGLLGDKYLALASIYAWGFGDAAAALAGKRFGRHKITGKFLDGKKSWEGTAAMFALSFVTVSVILWFRGGMGPAACLAAALGTALVSAAAELYSKNGLDTVVCPISAMGVLIPLVWFLGGPLS